MKVKDILELCDLNRVINIVEDGEVLSSYDGRDSIAEEYLELEVRQISSAEGAIIIEIGFSDSAGLPEGYAEVEYNDFEDAEAIAGSRWDDMNYLHYMER